ncbi:MAG: M3 family oligoendopeptidase [bacterium]
MSAWDLSELLPSEEDAVVSKRLAEIEDAVSALEERREELAPDMDRAGFLDILSGYEEILSTMQVVSAYGSLSFSADTLSSKTLNLRNRIQHVLTGLSNRILFFTLWWRNLDEEAAGRLLPEEEDGERSDYRHFLEDLRRFAPYTLEERSEQIINLKDANGIDAVLTLYSMLTNRLEFSLEVGREEKTLTRDGLMKYVRSPDGDLREAAYRELHRVYEEEAPVLGQIYSNRVRDWYSENVELRGFERPIEVRNLANDVPGEAVQTLLDVCGENRAVFQRYFGVKAELLGRDRLRRYDLYAPIGSADREVPYVEAVRTVLDTFQDFHPVLAEQAQRVFEEGHIDSELRKGKQGGAFCATVLPEHTPWLLVNYTGEVRDVATLAHELGHAVHSMLASDHSVLTQHPSLPLAETASVFGEMLVTDRLLASEDDSLVRRELLASALDDMYATVMRQAFFVKFETDAHEAVLGNASQEELNALYRENLDEQFGESLDLTDDFAYEWLSIPHIYNTPFYCYAYSFGQLLVLALYRRFQLEGDEFKPGYLRMLSYGGSARPQEILTETGIDMTGADFWQGGFDVISGLVDELEATG